MIEYLFDLFPYINSKFTIPNNTKDKEKNAFIALTATTNSVALISMYEYHFHALGTKKCHIPKTIEALLPIVTKILASRFKITPPDNVSSNFSSALSGFVAMFHRYDYFSPGMSCSKIPESFGNIT
jgi:hypothetical protein